MSKVLCGISGVEFQCEFLPISLSSREYNHPIFYLNQKKLLGLYQKYRHGELDSTSSYLLFLSYLESTELVEWRVPAKRTAITESLIANNFEHLVEIIEKMNRIKNPSIHFNRIAITPDTCNLSTVAYWLASWEETYDDFCNGYASQKERASLLDLEEKLELLVKDANRNETKFATRLAEWADKAGAFPKFPVLHEGSSLPCNSYWKLIIRKCVNSESIFTIPSNDLRELITHCEEYIDAGSIYAYNLFKILREGLEKQSSFLGLGDFQFSILQGDESVETVNKLAIISNAPDSEPKRVDYPTTFSYLKAKLAWDMKLNSEAGGK